MFHGNAGQDLADLDWGILLADGSPRFTWNAQEYAHNLRIKLDTRQAFNFVLRVCKWHGGTVWTDRRHRVESIGHGKNSGAQRNTGSLHPTRVAASIPAFVVGEDDFRCVGEERNAFDQIVSDPYMTLN